MVANVDAGGLNGPSILAATGSDAGWLIEQAAGVIPDPIGSSAIEALGSPATDYTLMFRKAGWVGFDFNLSWSKRIHSALDNVDNLNPDSIQHQGEHMLAVARRFGNLSLGFPRIPRPIYFDILGLTMLYYPTGWAIFILSGITLFYIGIMILGIRRKSLTVRGIGLGVAFFLLSLVTVPLLLAIVQLAIIQPVMLVNTGLASSLIGDTLLSNGIRWGTAILAVLATFLWYALFSRAKGIEKYDFAFAAYSLLYICAAITTAAFPALSYLFEWPLFAGLMAMLFWLPSNKGATKQTGWLQLSGLLSAGVIAVVLFIPGILIALLSVDLRMIYLVPVFVVALLGFLVPILAL
jgi:hypothetical protein